MRKALIGSLLVMMTSWFAAGCGHEQPPPPASVWPKPPEPPKEAVREAPVKPGRPSTGTVAVSDEIWRACNIRSSEPREAPEFGFDSTELSDVERRVLNQIARCFTHGALRGRAMRLTGRADPRGEPEYNMTLGASRSGNVKGYLGALGVDANKMDDTSRGELDASGEDEAGWARDRRVDIDLLK